MEPAFLQHKRRTFVSILNMKGALTMKLIIKVCTKRQKNAQPLTHTDTEKERKERDKSNGTTAYIEADREKHK